MTSVDGHARAAATDIAAAALARVQEPATRRVRVEDYLTALAVVTGEAALVAAGVFDIESSGLTPGSPVFGDPINGVLSGDVADLAAVPATSVVGVLVAELLPATYELAAFPPLEELYRNVAAGVGGAAWGAVPLTVPPDNAPTVLPLQVAFELRPAVGRAVEAAGVDQARRHVPCALGLAMALQQVQGAIDPSTGLRLALEVVFGMAKMVPMSKRAFAAASGGGAQG